MPLTPRDRRTLMIGGVILGVMLLGFLVMNVLSGGDGEEAIPSLPPITVSPGGGGEGPSVSPTTGVSPIPVFTGRDPFSIPPALSPTTTSPTSPTNGTSPPPTSPPPTSPPPTSPPPPGGNGDASSEIVGGKTVTLLAVFSSGGEPLVQVEVNEQVFNDIGIGDTFDRGRYELRSVSGDCATFLFGDESFTLCVSDRK